MLNGGALPIVCGDVVKHNAAYMRFTPETLKIYTVTFLEAGQNAPEFPSPEAETPSCGGSYNGTGFFNSGVLSPEQNYTLIFTKPGAYTYLCLVHDELKMKDGGAIVDFGNRKVIQQSTSDLRLLSDGSIVPGTSSKLSRDVA